MGRSYIKPDVSVVSSVSSCIGEDDEAQNDKIEIPTGLIMISILVDAQILRRPHGSSSGHWGTLSAGII
jgi:hypothetical protein